MTDTELTKMLRSSANRVVNYAADRIEVLTAEREALEQDNHRWKMECENFWRDREKTLTAERDHAWAMVAKADTQVGQSLADHMQAKAERDRLRAALEDIADHDTGATAGLAYTAKIALKGETP